MCRVMRRHREFIKIRRYGLILQEFLCTSYARGQREGSNSYAPQRLSPNMFDLALLAGFALLCACVAYERLTHRL